MATAIFGDKSMLAGVEDLAVLLNADSAGGQVTEYIYTRSTYYGSRIWYFRSTW